MIEINTDSAKIGNVRYGTVSNGIVTVNVCEFPDKSAGWWLPLKQGTHVRNYTMAVAAATEYFVILKR